MATRAGTPQEVMTSAEVQAIRALARDYEGDMD